MSDREDWFSDVKPLVSGLGGIFQGSDGLGELSKVSTPFQQTGQGIRAEFQCQNCGSPIGVEADWTELTYIMMKIPPPHWYKDQRAGLMRPEVGCSRCGEIVSVGLTPQECQKAINAGVEAGFISLQQVNQAVQRIKSLMPAR